MRQHLSLLIAANVLLSTLLWMPDARANVAIKTEDGQSSVYREVLDRLASRHYRTQKVDDALSQRYLDEYIGLLDAGKNYFLQSDIDEFEQWRLKLDDLAKRGDIKPGFIMFNRLRDRAMAQLQNNVALLEDPEFQFDFNGEASIILDGDERDWLASPEAADAFWLKRMTDALIRLLLNEKDLEEARELVAKRFKNQIKQFDQRDSQDVFQLYTNALGSLYDPHTSYLSPRTNENFKINMSLSLTGIGAELTTEDDYTKVSRIIPGGPADLQGVLKAEDKIVGVGQAEKPIVDVIGWRIDEVVELIRGEKDTKVRLELIPSKGDSSNTKTITIVRDKVKLEDKSAQSIILEIDLNGEAFKLGVIDIPAFYMDFEAYRARDPEFKSTTRDVYNLVEELTEANVDGIVLDLRNNGGGSLYEATSLTDLFIDYGPVVQIRDAEQKVYRNHRASRRAAYSGPLIVMINRLSASASEIFAGALQDYGRALIVGTQSFGKGTVQEVVELSEGQLKMTISKFYRVSGDSTQHRGVIPDIAFPSLHDIEKIGESEQDNALPWDRIHRVPHQTQDHLTHYVAPLTASHLKRRSADPDFASLVERIKMSDDWEMDKSLSLNLEQRRARSERWDIGLFESENKRLVAKGEEPFADLTAWKDSDEEGEENDNEKESLTENDQEDTLSSSSDQTQNNADVDTEEDTLNTEKDENIAESDPMLFEAGKVLSEQIQLQTQALSQRLAAAKSNKESNL
ncbi:MAG: carboxy terminal-processing peptidase [Porticoccaceae bacterium]|nr:carboxy terminal-processing peptidase [Porticoccaceae bacterium]